MSGKKEGDKIASKMSYFDTVDEIYVKTKQLNSYEKIFGITDFFNSISIFFSILEKLRVILINNVISEFSRKF